MEGIQSPYLRQLQGRLRGIAYQLTTIQFSTFHPQQYWCPAINAYRCRDSLVICVDLAGVERSRIDLQVEPRQVLIRGRRQPPEPGDIEGSPVQILALEIDHGPFERQVLLPLEIEPERAQAEQRNGMLWIHLPLPAPA